MAKNLPAYVSISKTGVYQYRRRVPDNLRELVGTREIKRGLGKDYATMLRKYGELTAAVDKLFAQKPTRRSNLQVSLMQALEERGFGAETIALLQDEDADGYDGLALAVLDALEDVDRKMGVSQELGREVMKGRPPLTLEFALEDYKNHKATGDATADKIHAQRIDRSKERLIRYLGKEAVTSRHLSKLRRVDANKFRDGLLSELSASSTRRALNDVNAAVNRAILEFDLECSNVFARLTIKGDKNTREKRLPFDDQDIVALAPIMETYDDLGTIWVTLRDTGARLNEIVGLRGCDVDEERKTIWIRSHEGRSIKTDHSDREVPVPDSVLVRLAALKGKPEDPLFPRYASRARGNDTCSQTLMKRLRKVVKEDRKVVYSLRHRMKDMLRDTDCPEDLAREIMGHSDQSSAANYGRGHSIERKRKALEKVWEASQRIE